jgi:hypothetical protein
MSSFQHLDGMVALLSELYHLHSRIECGDIVSAKAAIKSKRMEKLLKHYHEALSEDGATDIRLEAYAAAGGWVGVTYSYTFDGFEVAGSQVPRRV